jgi:hypothetical protein
MSTGKRERIPLSILEEDRDATAPSKGNTGEALASAGDSAGNVEAKIDATKKTKKGRHANHASKPNR